MTDGDLEIHVLADSTGETAVRLARAARAQFPGAHFEIVRHPRLGKLDAMMKALGTLRERADRPIAVFFTLVNADLRSLVINACEDLAIPYTDLMGDALVALERISGHTADEVPMRPVGVEADYFVRGPAPGVARPHHQTEGLGPCPGRQLAQHVGVHRQELVVHPAIQDLQPFFQAAGTQRTCCTCRVSMRPSVPRTCSVV